MEVGEKTAGPENVTCGFVVNNPQPAHPKGHGAVHSSGRRRKRWENDETSVIGLYSHAKTKTRIQASSPHALQPLQLFLPLLCKLLIQFKFNLLTSITCIISCYCWLSLIDSSRSPKPCRSDYQESLETPPGECVE